MSNCIPENAEWYLDEFDAERFWSRVRFSGGQGYLADPLVDLHRVKGECWLWLGENNNDYGRFRIYGTTRSAHVLSYLDFNNKIPDGWQVDHLCRQKRCVNPAHLEAVIPAENIARGKLGRVRAEKCKRGHPMSGENLIESPRGQRGKKLLCRTCRNADALTAYYKRKQGHNLPAA